MFIGIIFLIFLYNIYNIFTYHGNIARVYFYLIY